VMTGEWAKAGLGPPGALDASRLDSQANRA
jgi:hypothetical protein